MLIAADVFNWGILDNNVLKENLDNNVTPHVWSYQLPYVSTTPPIGDSAVGVIIQYFTVWSSLAKCRQLFLGSYIIMEHSSKSILYKNFITTYVVVKDQK